MSIHAPPADWFKAPSGAERMWVGLALCFVGLFGWLMPLLAEQ